MKLKQKEAAQRIYFQTEIPVAHIAEVLQVSERTVHYWIEDNGWAEIKKCAHQMPIKLADNCYQILSNIQDHLLSEERKNKPATHLEVNSMHKLVNTITKLRTRNTLNENIELNTYFLEYVAEQSPAMAASIKPFIDDFLAIQAKATRQNKIQFETPQVAPAPTPKTQPINETDSDLLTEEELEYFKKEYPELYKKACDISQLQYENETKKEQVAVLNTQPASLNTFATPPSLSGLQSRSDNGKGRAGVPLNRAQRRKLERARKAA